MAQMQREMDSVLGSFGFPTADPFDLLLERAATPLAARRAPLLPAVGSLTRLLPLVRVSGHAHALKRVRCSRDCPCHVAA